MTARRLFTLLLLCAIAITAEAQIVGATDSESVPSTTTRTKTQRVKPAKQPRPKKEYPKNRPSGLVLDVEAGYPLHGQLTFGGQLGPSVMIGIGASYQQGVRENAWMPLYLQMRFSTPRYRFAPYLDLKAGTDLWQIAKGDWPLGDSPMRFVSGMATIGVYIHDFHLGAGINLYYDEQLTYFDNGAIHGVKQGLFWGIRGEVGYNIPLTGRKKTSTKKQ